MKVSLLVFIQIICLSIGLSAQITDTISSKKIDSLINVSRNLLDKRNYSQAMEICELAEKLALSTFTRESAEYGLCCHKSCPNSWNLGVRIKRGRKMVFGSHINQRQSTRQKTIMTMEQVF